MKNNCAVKTQANVDKSKFRIVSWKRGKREKMLSLEERVEIVLIVGDGYRTTRETAEIFAQMHPGQTVQHSTVPDIINALHLSSES